MSDRKIMIFSHRSSETFKMKLVYFRVIAICTLNLPKLFSRKNPSSRKIVAFVSNRRFVAQAAVEKIILFFRQFIHE